MATQVGQAWVLHWTMNGAIYTLEAKGAVGSTASVAYEQAQPSVDRLMACLGAPSRYRAVYSRDPSGYHISIQLLFPSEGVLAYGAKFTGREIVEAPQIDGGVAFSLLNYVQSGSDEEVLRRSLSPQFVDVEKMIRQDYKEWPGRLEKITIDIDPSLQQ